MKASETIALSRSLLSKRRDGEMAGEFQPDDGTKAIQNGCRLMRPSKLKKRYDQSTDCPSGR